MTSNDVRGNDNSPASACNSSFCMPREFLNASNDPNAKYLDPDSIDCIITFPMKNTSVVPESLPHTDIHSVLTASIANRPSPSFRTNVNREWSREGRSCSDMDGKDERQRWKHLLLASSFVVGLGSSMSINALLF